MSKLYESKPFKTGFASALLLNFFIYILGVIWYAIFQNIISIYEWSILSALLLGLFQFIYVVPIVIWHGLKRNKKYVYGITAGALVTLVISTAILVYFYILLMDMNF